MDDVTKVFLQGVKSTELEAAVNLVQAKQDKCGKDFDVTVTYLGQMIMKKFYIMQSINIAKTRSQPLKPK